MFGKLFGLGGSKAKTERLILSREETLALLADGLAPTLMLEATDAPVFSKLGGTPDLPADVPWPQRWGEPAPFLAQIDVAEAHGAGAPDWAPSEGRLFFFGAPNGDGRAALVHRPDHSNESGIAVPQAPKQGPRLVFGEQRVAMRPALSLDDDFDMPEALGETSADLPPEILGRDSDRPQHRLFGHRDAIQFGNLGVRSEMERAGIPSAEQAKLFRKHAIPPDIAERAKDWRLLLQVDSDERLGMEFGDGGRIYFMVREQDARAGDFSTVMMFAESS